MIKATVNDGKCQLYVKGNAYELGIETAILLNQVITNVSRGNTETKSVLEKLVEAAYKEAQSATTVGFGIRREWGEKK